MMHHMVVPRWRPMMDDPTVMHDPMMVNRVMDHHHAMMDDLRCRRDRHHHAQRQQAGD
jgi:hypothetical protein